MQITMREALKLAIRDEMASDPSVVVFGEDVAEAGGVFKVTAGLFGEFGPDRVRDTPIAETAILGAAIGAATRGLRPVVEIMFVEFFGVALDQIVTEAEDALPLGRKAAGPDGRPRFRGWRTRLRSSALTDAGIVVHEHPGPHRRLAIGARERVRVAARRDPQ